MEIMPRRSSDLRLGELVSSRAGRDAGSWFLVVGREGERFVRVADGKRRRLEGAKRKNVLHLVAHAQVSPELEVKLASGVRVSDQEVRKALEAMLSRRGGEGQNGQG
ncbi:MAG: KOW domain-containing RNA-binding protein [Thermaerobacter sp.]|jgi:ribosomal protein L14E/L6E/L27E|nr:KOW domain-containing RNA-binding protein [Thermaerobacter sp.]MDA8145563.1 KOW domain-containing RNA-binding protein [Thermaerobacter sp.]